jgi:ring-1,2-phenylacetyl-CoA epoxidase subunit PaaD
MVKEQISEEIIWEALKDVKDPEIPKISVVDMGIITSVKITEDGDVIIAMTPTFAGCPAVNVMKADIMARVEKLQVRSVEVEVNFDVQWSTDMISEHGIQMLKESNFALPGRVDGFVSVESLLKVECPFCGSKSTRLQTPFGPTQCRAIHYCDNCMQSFEQFKPV